MVVSVLNSTLAGALFGGALTAAGMFAPGIIIGQLQLENFHMLKTFLMASATSAIAISLAQKLNFTSCKPRLPNSLGLFSKYDGNIVGGTLLGFGLALTGACPGTVLPQVATGVPSGPLVLAGGLLGGALYSKFGKPLQKTADPEKATVYESFGISRASGTIIFEALCLSAIGIFNYLFVQKTPLLVPAVWGGLLVGLSQEASLVLTGNTLGISGAYEHLGDYFWWAEKSVFEPSKKGPAPKLSDNLFFAIGTIVGSFLINKLVDLPPSTPVEISTVRALAGGTIMIFGSRIAGGCTSGHGVSGMSQLSISSIITVSFMFGGGIILTTFL